MGSTELSAFVKVQVTVEILAPGTYGADWKLDEIHEQAVREALTELRCSERACPKCGVPVVRRGLTVVGEPKIVDVVIRKNV